MRYWHENRFDDDFIALKYKRCIADRFKKQKNSSQNINNKSINISIA